LGSITGNNGSWDLYASSKAALNMLMKCYTAHRPDDRRAKLVVAPGWIQTDMGGSEATYTVEECIPLVVDMLEKDHGKPVLPTSTASTRRCLGNLIWPTNNVSAARAHIDQGLASRSRLELNTIGSD
jgi:NAD(P)-dependent dehydrogenase (short-subunit alcohol dehydrogenase family)